MLGEQPLRICGIGALWSDPAHGDVLHARVLVERLVDEARREGADLAMVCASPASTTPMLDGFGVIAREPVERRPVIRGWLPPGFVPPQVTIVSTQPDAEILLAGPLTVTVDGLALFSDDVLYWRSDVL